MKIFFSLTILFTSLLCFSQKDSSNYRTLGFESGIFNYASIDELFNPFIYSGRNVNYSLFTKKFKTRSRTEFKLDFASITREPENIVVPDYYRVVSYDSKKTYDIESEKGYRLNETYFLSFTFSYHRKINLRLIANDGFFLGFSSYNSLIYRYYIEDPELISLNISPGFLYQINFSKRHNLSFAGNITLLGLTLRKPYAGAVAQVSDNFNSFDYLFDNLSLDFLNDYFRLSSRINYERSFTRRFVVNIFYDFSYVNLSHPRKLVSVSNTYGLGLFYKFGKHGN